MSVPHLVRDVSRGTGEEFLYFECSECGCLFNGGPPRDMEPWNPPRELEPGTGPLSIARRIGAALRLRPKYGKVRGLRQVDLNFLGRVRLTRDMALLDVSSGAYTMVQALRESGYDAQAADPEDFPGNASGSSGTRMWLESMGRKFDVLLFRHSLERLPIEMLASARNFIRQNGCCVACIALLGWAWRTYGTDWVQLNAQRYRVIHSRKSFSLLALKSGFRIDQVVFDSTEYQILASDTLQRNLPLSKMPAPSRAERARMRKIADDLNRQHQGDTAQFYLKPV